MDAGATTQDELPEVSLDALVGRTVGGRFKVLRGIGRGGMGAVYEVERGADRAALKIIARDAKGVDARTLKRFEREAALASEIEHVNVTRTFELGRDAELDAPFLLMELLSGKDLGAVIDETSPLLPEVAARMAVQAARGLAAAHARGIIHRDVKPQNLFLHRDGDVLTVKVCDFGIAKLGEQAREEDASSLTNSGGIIGSPRYMSPEQAQGAKDIDARTDVWSLCASLHEALSGRRLWGAETLGELIVAICTKPVPRLALAAPWVPLGLSDVVQRGLARDRASRWSDMAELEAALLPFTANTTVIHADDVKTVPSGSREQPASARIASTRGDTTHAPAAVPVEPTKSPWLGVGGAAIALVGGAAFLAFGRTPHETSGDALGSMSVAPQGPDSVADPPETVPVRSVAASASSAPGTPLISSAIPNAVATTIATPTPAIATPSTTATGSPTTATATAAKPSATARPTAVGSLPTTEDWR